MRFASRATIVALGFGWALLLATNGAFAQGPADGDGKVVAAREAARALALKALAKIDSGQVAEGIALLEQAEASFHAPTHLLYLAQAHASMGHAARAAQTYDTLVREELPNYAPDEFREAERIGRVELRAVESKVGRIKLVLIGAPDGAKPTVRLDGASVPIAADVLYAEPGPREVEVTIGEQTRKARVTARAGQEDSLLFEVGAVEPRVRQGDVGFAEPPKEAGAPFVIPGVILLTAGGVALAVGGVTGTLSFKDVDELSDRCPTRVGCDPADRELADSARLLGNVSTAMFVIGGVAAVTGAVLVAIPAPEKSARVVRARLGPLFLGMEGSF